MFPGTPVARAVAAGTENNSAAIAAAKLARVVVRLLSSRQEPAARTGACQYVSCLIFRKHVRVRAIRDTTDGPEWRARGFRADDRLARRRRAAPEPRRPRRAFAGDDPAGGPRRAHRAGHRSRRQAADRDGRRKLHTAAGADRRAHVPARRGPVGVLRAGPRRRARVVLARCRPDAARADRVRGRRQDDLHTDTKDQLRVNETTLVCPNVYAVPRRLFCEMSTTPLASSTSPNAPAAPTPALPQSNALGSTIVTLGV